MNYETTPVTEEEKISRILDDETDTKLQKYIQAFETTIAELEEKALSGNFDEEYDKLTTQQSETHTEIMKLLKEKHGISEERRNLVKSILAKGMMTKAA